MKKRIMMVLFLLGLGLASSCSSPPECEVDQECQPGYLCQKVIGKCYCPGSVCAGRCADLTKDNTHCGECNNTCSGGQSCSFSKCECPDNQVFCDKKCLDVSSNSKHCGACGVSCKGTAVCLNGKCRDKCPEKTPNVCDGGCVDHKTDDNHCGKCGTVCANGTQCRDGKCTCTGGFNNCKDKCVDVDSDPAHCGGCGKACGSGEKCASGRCLSDCPKSTPTVCLGSCVDLKSNRLHCGKCGTVCSKGKICSGSACECPVGQSECQGECVDSRTDQRNCGACGKACASGQVCSDGQCLLSCPKSTQKKCFGGCFNTKTDPKHCGDCGKACVEGQVCNGGTCQCPSPYKLCGGKCVINKIHPLHCGDCDNACKKGEVCNNGTCDTSCPKGQGVCYGGCINTKTSLEHCGGCGIKCGLNRVCKEGVCGCPGERTECAKSCVDLQTDALNCGACGNKCQAGEKCLKGKCQIVCDTRPFDTNCNGACVDIVADKRHCGACGNVCPGRKICGKDTNNKIACVCPSGFTDCNGSCVDVKTSVQNCGKCGVTCDPGKVCTGGKCELNCAKNETKCNGVCVDVQTNRRHCGGCGTTCPGGAACESGLCKCANNRTNCKNVCINTDIDPSNCGGCGKKCPAGQRCEGGKCQLCPSTAKTCGTLCCPGALVCCGGNTCADTKTDYRHCGACGQSCKNSERCCGGNCREILTDNNNCGACGLQCKSGETCCNGSCVDVKQNKTHCGSCGNICDNDSDCCAGVCKNLKKDFNHCSACGTTCKQGEGCCGGTCISLQADNKNCGACGSVCKSGTQCCGGGCVDLQSSAKYCGSCTNACKLGSICNNGKCIQSWATQGVGLVPSSSELGYSVGTDSSGNVYIVGRYYGKFKLGTFALPTSYNQALYVAKLNSKLEVQWAKGIVGSQGINFYDWGEAASVDKNGNTYITGYFSGVLSASTITLTSSPKSTNLFVGKIDKDGKWQWLSTSKNTKTDTGKVVSTDSSGNVIVSGELYGTSTFGTITLKNSNRITGFVAKLDSSGKWVWATLSSGTGSQYVWGIAVDKSDNTLITGYFDQNITFGSTTLTSLGGSRDLYVAKIDKSGKWLWAVRGGGTGTEYPRAVGLDSSGNAYVTGYFSGTNATFGGGSSALSLSSAGSWDVFVAKLSAAGKWNWAKKLGGKSSDVPYDIKVDSAGNSYVIGFFRNSQTIPGTSINLVNRGSNDLFVAKIDTNGKWIFAKSMGGPNAESVNGLGIDPSGNLFLTGSFDRSVSFGTLSLSADGYRDMYVAKLDKKGDVLAAKSFAAQQSNSDFGYSIAADNQGNTYVTGFVYGDLSFGSIQVKADKNNQTYQDIFVAKLNPAGNVLWAKRYGGRSSDYGYTIDIDKNNNIFVAGTFRDTISFGTTKLSSKLSSPFVLKLDSNGKELWAKHVPGNQHNECRSISVDKNGNSFITGTFANTATFGTVTINSSNRSTDVFVAKLDPTGKWLWAIGVGGTRSDYGFGISVDSQGNAAVTGYFQNSVAFGKTTVVSKGYFDAYVAKISSNGTWIWAKSVGDRNYDISYGVTTDQSNNVVITGYYSGKVLFGATTLTSQNGSRDIYVAKLDSNGKWLWAFSAGGTSSDYSYGVDVDSKGNVYATGRTYGNATFGTTTFSSNTNYCFVLKLDKDGKFLWSKATSGEYNSAEGYSIKVNSNGNLYVTGAFSGKTFFDKAALFSVGGQDIFVWQVSPK